MVCIGKIRPSASSCMHSSKLSTLTNPLTKLTPIASFSLCEPPKNNGLSNCSLLTLLSTHIMKSFCSAVLIFDADKNWAISKGKVFMSFSNCFYVITCCSSPLLTCFDAVFFVHIKKQYPPDYMTWKKSLMHSRDWWKYRCMFLGFDFLLTVF